MVKNISTANTPTKSKDSASLTASSLASLLASLEMFAGLITNSTWLDILLNSISTVSKQLTLPSEFLETITLSSLSNGINSSIIISESGRELISSVEFKIFTPKPSYPNFVFFQTHGNEISFKVKDFLRSLIDLKNLKLDVGILLLIKKDF